MYRIKLPEFDGPFDLLLFFIKRDELDIYNIPIFRITQEFLNYIRLMQMFDLELAGEFLVMASTLVQIKTRKLLPVTEAENGEEIENLETELRERLQYYSRFKAAASELSEKAEQEKYHYYRHLFDADRRAAEKNSLYREASLFDLLRALKSALERNKVEPKAHTVRVSALTVREKASRILEKLREVKRIGFLELTEGGTREDIVVTLLALLELMKLQEIFVSQNNLFDDISVSARPESNSKKTQTIEIQVTE